MKRMYVLSALAVGAVMTALVVPPALAANQPTATITSIKPGQTLTGEQIPVQVAIKNFRLECADVGKPGRPGQGHIHAMLDGTKMEQLANFFCQDSFDISGVGVTPGKHVLAVTLADDAHMDVTKPVTVAFDYKPTSPKPLPGAMTGGKPSVAIASPANGASVGKTFNLVVNVKNFDLSCDLEGKRNVAGFGHLHLFVMQPGVTDAHMKMNGEHMMGSSMKREMHGMKGEMGGMKGGMMSMVGMISMPCTKTVPVDLTSWHSGKAHVLVMLANNDHMPAMGAASSEIDVTLK